MDVLGAAVTTERAVAEDFEQAVRAEGPRLFGLSLAVLGRPELAEEAVQETFERAWRVWATLDDPDKRRAWLARVCLNRSLDVRRYLKRRLRLAFQREGDHGPQSAELGLDLGRAMEHLTRRQRAIIGLHYACGYTLDECAAMIGCQPGTARSHLGRALTTLRGQLGDTRHGS